MSGVPASHQETPADSWREVERLLCHEAHLLDDARFDDWLEMFTADGVYWVPSKWGQTDALGVASIIYDDRPLLAIRVKRLAQGRAPVLSPMPRTTHLVGNVDLVGGDAAKGELRSKASFVMVEHREDRQRIYSGRYSHVLRRVAGELKIVLKRVDLINCDSTHDGLVMPF